MNVQIASVGMIYWGKSLGGGGLGSGLGPIQGSAKMTALGLTVTQPPGTKEGANTDGSEGRLLD